MQFPRCYLLSSILMRNWISNNWTVFRPKITLLGLTIGGSVSGILDDFVITDLLDRVIEKSGFELSTLKIKRKTKEQHHGCISLLYGYSFDERK